MSDLILAGMVATFTLLPASIVLYRRATEAPEAEPEAVTEVAHRPGGSCGCRSCSELRHPRYHGLRDQLRTGVPPQREGRR
ncbi:hypothetical protein [Streptomyces bacillaris]|uniref:hypothetical protein n=1 Tax=Streptomyces bacillaris TaxID=68179 RepID=UPI0036269FF5